MSSNFCISLILHSRLIIEPSASKLKILIIFLNKFSDLINAQNQKWQCFKLLYRSQRAFDKKRFVLMEYQSQHPPLRRVTRGARVSCLTTSEPQVSNSLFLNFFDLSRPLCVCVFIYLLFIIWWSIKFKLYTHGTKKHQHDHRI